MSIVHHLFSRRWMMPAALLALGACADEPTMTARPETVSALTSSSDLKASQKFRDAVTVGGVSEHLFAFSAISAANGGNLLFSLASGTATEDYIAAKLVAAGYIVRFQYFSVQTSLELAPPVLQQVAPSAVTYATPADIVSFVYSGSGDVTAPVTGAGNFGCDAADFAGFPAGKIALIRRGICTFQVKAANAIAAGASAVIIVNFDTTRPDEPVVGTFPSFAPSAVPVVGVSLNVGNTLFAALGSGLTVHVVVNRLNGPRTGRNVIADSKTGSSSKLVTIGAPMTYSQSGPGIAAFSGAAAMLEIAEEYARSEGTPRNRVRFVWFGGARFGATTYVESLTGDERSRSAVMLSIESIGDPNFGRFVFSSAIPEPAFPTLLASSLGVEPVLADYFSAVGLTTKRDAISASWLVPAFLSIGVPATGLGGGDRRLKTAEEASLFGGTAGVAFNPCVGLPCDNLQNVSNVALDQMTDAAAHATLSLSRRNFDKNALTSP